MCKRRRSVPFECCDLMFLFFFWLYLSLSVLLYQIGCYVRARDKDNTAAALLLFSIQCSIVFVVCFFVVVAVFFLLFGVCLCLSLAGVSVPFIV